MSGKVWPVAIAAMALAVPAWADDTTPVMKLADAQADQSVYALPTATSEEQGINAGGVNLDMKVVYLTDYIYRGVNRGEALNAGRNVGNANFQFDGTLAWNLGKLPHPFVGILTNVLDSDPVSNFQEVRPFFGAEWRIRPLVIAAGNTLYTFPDRGELDTSEVWTKITLDDSTLFHSDTPVLSPYIYGAYDYDLYNGWYLEAGVSHDFPIEKTGLTVTAVADVAYVASQGYFAGPQGDDTGFQHYEVGLIGRYSLNELLNIPMRYGQWSVNGYLYYTDGLSDELLSDTTVWGGVGIQFTY
ncbi:MAG TPA: hypothetical protein VHP11_12080 [Tepidisphaeraceae bacterium]|nr:hypothetical protein [Tepidisphaeraceae bacterium]